MKYQIDKEARKRKIGRKKILQSGFLMKLRLKSRKDFIEVKEITILQEKLKEKALKKQFRNAFKKMFRMVQNITSDEGATDGDIKIAFSELERMKAILKDKYRNELHVKDFYAMWRKVLFLEGELKEKIREKERIQEMMFQQMLNLSMSRNGNNIYEEERGRSR